MKKPSHITVTDQFCGAGGSSQGVRNASKKLGGGLDVHLAMNHWKLAVDTHNSNFPNTLHDCADISNSDPRRYPSTDILITSPECTNHSLAKGKSRSQGPSLFDSIDDAAERSRATMWDVPRFAEYHKYNIIIVENVVDARYWCMWDSWLMAMHSLGYSHKCTYLNSMHFWPTPQSRDRMYVIFWKKGNKAPDLDYRPLAFSPSLGKDINAIQTWKNPRKQFGKYRSQYLYRCPETNDVVEPYYYASFNCIDWTNLGIRIGDRKKPLSPNTIRRINYGIKKYGNSPFQVINYTPGYARPINDPIYTITTNDHTGLLSPFVVNDQHSTGINFRVRGMDDVLNTIPTVHHLKLINMPMIAKLEHSRADNVIKGDMPLSTQTTRQSMSLIIPPAYIINMNRTGHAHPADHVPMRTFTAGGINHALLFNPADSNNAQSGKVDNIVKPAILTKNAMHSFITYYYGQSQASGMHGPLGTITTKDRMALITGTEKVDINDCYYRMLMTEEIQRGMAFDDAYIVLGNSKEKTKQLGNAVTPPVMEWLITQCVQSLN